MNAILLDIPETIETARLLLRAPKAGDGEIVAEAVRESLVELKAWMPWATDDYDAKSAEEWCRKAAAEFIERKQIQYRMFQRSGEYAGNLGAFAFDWNVPNCEIGYWLRTRFCGQGLMAEAVNGLTEMLRHRAGMKRIEIRCDDLNIRSARVAQRCGFTLEGVLRNQCRTHHGVLRHTRIYALIAEEQKD